MGCEVGFGMGLNVLGRCKAMTRFFFFEALEMIRADDAERRFEGPTGCRYRRKVRRENGGG